MLKFLTSAALVFGAIAAHAADNTTQIITDALHKVAPNAKVQSIAESKIPGLYNVVTDGHVILMSGDGKYLIEGHAYDIDAHTDLMHEGMTEARKEGLAKIPQDKKIIFAPPQSQIHGDRVHRCRLPVLPPVPQADRRVQQARHRGRVRAVSAVDPSGRRQESADRLVRKGSQHRLHQRHERPGAAAENLQQSDRRGQQHRRQRWASTARRRS